jgi:membrane-associated phospholipid phosphatase
MLKHNHSYYLVFIILANLHVNAQNHHFKLDVKNDMVLSVSAGMTLATGLYLKSQTPVPTSFDLKTLDKEQLNFFDREVFNLPSQNRVLLSDYMLVGASMASFSLLAFREAREDILPLLVIYYQSLSFTNGLTSISKATFRRFRPYAYIDNTNSDRSTRDARHSFFSGHTSAAAALSFTTGYTITRYVESPALDKVIWGIAAIVPAYTGYLRMVSRKHFPMDIIIGYLVGGSIGVIIPKIHEIKSSNDRVKVGLTGNSFYITLNL